MQNMKPVQYAQVSYFAHFSRHFFNFETNGYFHLIFIYLFFEGGWVGGGVTVEVILEDFIIGEIV